MTLWLILALGGLVTGAASPRSDDASGKDGLSRPAHASAPGNQGTAAPEIEIVVLIIVDTLHWDAVGFGGDGDGVTPALGLATSGIVFLDARYGTNINRALQLLRQLGD